MGRPLLMMMRSSVRTESHHCWWWLKIVCSYRITCIQKSPKVYIFTIFQMLLNKQVRPSFFNYLDHNPARPCWNTPDHKIKSSFSFYFYISRRPYFYIRIYTIKQITRNQISSTCAHHWNNSQQFMCCQEFFYFDPTDPTFLQHFIFFIPNRPTWFFCNNFFRDPSNKKMMA